MCVKVRIMPIFTEKDSKNSVRPIVVAVWQGLPGLVNYRRPNCRPRPCARSPGAAPDPVESQPAAGPPAVASIQIGQRTIVPLHDSAFVSWGHLPQLYLRAQKVRPCFLLPALCSCMHCCRLPPSSSLVLTVAGLSGSHYRTYFLLPGGS